MVKIFFYIIIIIIIIHYYILHYILLYISIFDTLKFKKSEFYQFYATNIMIFIIFHQYFGMRGH